MTSSLVGSEMCIRDSSLPGRFDVLQKHARTCNSPGYGALRHSREAPVSYTHLTLPTICSV
eukprot:9241853-Prorocentrum_lima.AAC.1